MTRVRWKVRGVPLVSKQTKALLQYIRTLRNSGAHSGGQESDEDNFRQTAAIMAISATSFGLGRRWLCAGLYFAAGSSSFFTEVLRGKIRRFGGSDPGVKGPLGIESSAVARMEADAAVACFGSVSVQQGCTQEIGGTRKKIPRGQRKAARIDRITIGLGQATYPGGRAIQDE